MARKWLGRRSATKNASATGPAPRIAASMMSRTKPGRRDTSVSPPTARMRSILVCSWSASWPGLSPKSGLPDFGTLNLRSSGRPELRAIHVFFASRPPEDVDARDKRGHGEMRRRCGSGLPAERPVHRVDDPILRRLVQIGVDRQADDLL